MSDHAPEVYAALKAQAKNRTLSIDVVREALAYNSDTGEMLWKARPTSHFRAVRDCTAWNGRYANTVAGNVTVRGYRTIILFNALHYAHRIAWALHYGSWPKNQIDHINHNRGDNRICNLRDVTGLENMKNQSLVNRNTSGVTGVSWDKRSEKWRAVIRHNYRNITIGIFDSFEEAVSARKAAEVKMDFHPNHGRKLKEASNG